MVTQAGIGDMNHFHREVDAVIGPVKNVDSGPRLRREVDDACARMRVGGNYNDRKLMVSPEQPTA
jgi:hypothetical protein